MVEIKSISHITGYIGREFNASYAAHFWQPKRSHKRLGRQRQPEEKPEHWVSPFF
jgi:hypothetical protein